MATSTTTTSPEKTFGDLLGRIMSDLPPNIKSDDFLKALSGLNASESATLCRYLRSIEPTQQARVVNALMSSSLAGKQKFLNQFCKLKSGATTDGRKKISELWTTHGDGSHSSTALLSSDKNNTSTSSTSSKSRIEMFKNTRASKSTASLPQKVTDAEITNVGKLLYKAHLDNNTSKTNHRLSPKPAAKQKLFKRERPKSNWELLQVEQSAEQKPKSEKVLTPTSQRNSNNDSTAEPTSKRWTKLQDESLRESVNFYGEKNWKAIAARVPGRNHAQCLQRWRKVLKPGLVKGHWAYEEDQVLESLVKRAIPGSNINWGQLAEAIPGRTAKQCRERWRNHLNPSINKGPYTEAEDEMILSMQSALGNKWSQIASMLGTSRTEDSVKIRWKSLKQNPQKAASSRLRRGGNATLIEPAKGGGGNTRNDTDDYLSFFDTFGDKEDFLAPPPPVSSNTTTTPNSSTMMMSNPQQQYSTSPLQFDYYNAGAAAARPMSNNNVMSQRVSAPAAYNRINNNNGSQVLPSNYYYNGGHPSSAPGVVPNGSSSSSNAEVDYARFIPQLNYTTPSSVMSAPTPSNAFYYQGGAPRGGVADVFDDFTPSSFDKQREDSILLGNNNNTEKKPMTTARYNDVGQEDFGDLNDLVSDVQDLNDDLDFKSFDFSF